MQMRCPQKLTPCFRSIKALSVLSPPCELHDVMDHPHAAVGRDFPRSSRGVPADPSFSLNFFRNYLEMYVEPEIVHSQLRSPMEVQQQKDSHTSPTEEASPSMPL